MAHWASFALCCLGRAVGPRSVEAQVRGHRVAEVRQLKQPEEENRRLKQLVADLSLDKQILLQVY